LDKREYAHTLRILLSLDSTDEKELNKLSIALLEKMYDNYIQNAKDANHAIERAAQRPA
jgi:hypothetical protein